ncbi:hypothetical protein FA95DRAFT_1452180, partial [Auriscalpium vulgare]
LPSNIRVLITSRPEATIVNAFRKAPQGSVATLHMDDITLAADTKEDIKIYIASQQFIVEPSLIGQLTEKAESLFQWAAVACKYISNPAPGLTTKDRIQRLLLPSSMKQFNPLDTLYDIVLNTYFKDSESHPRFKSVMSQLLATFEPLSVSALTSLQVFCSPDEQKDDESVTAIVSCLGSLLSNVTVKDQPVVPLHTSFRDFLLDKRSDIFYIDIAKAHLSIVNSCLKAMQAQSGLRFNICKLTTSHLANKDVYDLQSRIEANIPSHLSYACCYWGMHLEHCGFEETLCNDMKLFFETKFLYWLEVLSLMGKVHLATQFLGYVKLWLFPQVSIVTELIILVNDMIPFLQYFGLPISRSAPHIYLSALPFAPQSSQGVWNQYKDNFPNTVLIRKGQLNKWPAL